MNNKLKKFAFVSIFIMGSVQFLSARENVGSHRTAAPSGGNQIAASCSKSTSRKDLDINNIRTPIFINGDMWWDLVGNAQYEVPKDSKKYSLFAGALWIGGQDNSGGLKVAAQTYRQSGSDFWPGPVDTTGGAATTSATICARYDRHWRLTVEEVQAFSVSDHSAPITDIKEWPAKGNFDVSNSLAPFHDANSDGYYDPLDGDYPGYNLNIPSDVPDALSATGEYLLGDQTIWWVFNDVGNTHSETGGNVVGLEIQAQAFAFATNDEVNNMTFYKYKIINRSANTINRTYFGAWVDPDLGNYLDDYVGCDVKRGFGYCYNGDNYDEGITGYGFNPPSIGYDFFQGPKADVGDGLDNDRDSCLDCTYYIDANGVRQSVPDSVLPELIIMSKFVYYNNDGSFIGNPNTATDYYNYMKGIWKDGIRMTYGGNGHGGGQGTTADTCDFMFPGDSDPNHWGTYGVAPAALWDEVAAGNSPDDRRFLQSAGPFTLQPGAVNYITTGAVWGRASSGGQLASVQLIRNADDKAQKLFDHNFAITNGPDAPDLSIREFDGELLFAITNPAVSNNFNEVYTEIDPNLSISTSDPRYHFEGYQVFQLKDPTVTTNDIHDVAKARLVFQCDTKNGVGQIVNQFKDPNTSAFYGVEEVNGADNGLRHVFRIKKDKFATGNDDLINHKTYYYTVIAYGYNRVEADEFNYNNTTDGDGKPYISGRRRINTYTGIPHIKEVEAGGLVLNSAFGDGPKITRLEGQGNGHIIGSDRLALDMTQASIDEIIFNTTNPNRCLHPAYERSRGPVDIRVYDPVKVVGGTFQIREIVKVDTIATTAASSHDAVIGSFHADSSIVTDTMWTLTNLATGVTSSSVKTLRTPYDQLQFPDANNPAIVPDYGFYINMTQLYDLDINQKIVKTLNPGDFVNGVPVPGFIEANLSFAEGDKNWLTGLADRDDIIGRDWIASGKNASDYPYNGTGTLDGTQAWEKLIGGTWAPYKFVQRSASHNGPAYNNSDISTTNNKFAAQASVNIVFTPDKRYWTKCMVLEEQPVQSKAVGRAIKCLLRKSPSLDINGNVIAGDTGFSYFPGYAINVETGERLNVAFGEDSYLCPDSGFTSQTGKDMKWNPTSTIAGSGVWSYNPDSVFYILGGRHVVYVFGPDKTLNLPLYDSCQALSVYLKNPNSLTNIKKAWGSCMWVGYPLLRSAHSNLETTATVRIRVAKPYSKYQTDAVPANETLPFYQFNTDDLVPTKNDLATAKTALDLINVVPNPYYAFSSYESNQLDNRIKITNLPAKCKITIYTPSGTLIRTLNREVSSDNTSGGIYPETNLETALEWDLKNTAGIPIASGVYIIHVDAPGIGEKTIKWFGVLRPIDLDTF